LPHPAAAPALAALGESLGRWCTITQTQEDGRHDLRRGAAARNDMAGARAEKVANHQWTFGDLAIKVCELKVYSDATLERYANASAKATRR
jgi:hypothetical protein